jgi:dihydrofolate synthase/folylpolyglutamate synthase
MEYIKKLWKFGSHLGLDRIEALLELLGNPHKSIKTIHIAGTNGKGSSAAMTDTILREAGFKTGLYTSPYLERFTERIRIDGEEISQHDVAKLITHMEPLIEKLVLQGFEHPTEFEVITAAAFYYFKEEGVDFAVMEVGLGGRLDATNVITPEVALITPVGMDHKDRLGDTLGKIAFEKAGIIKEDIPTVVSYQQGEALDVILKTANGKNSTPYVFGKDFSFTRKNGLMDYKGLFLNLNDIKINLIGNHQLINGASVIALMEVLNTKGYNINNEAIRKGLGSVKWPGRMEVISSEPLVMLDGAHNHEGIVVLIDGLKDYFPQKKYVFALGVLQDKEVDKIIERIAPISSRIFTMTPDSDRSLPAGELMKLFDRFIRGKGLKGVPLDAIDSTAEDIYRVISSIKPDEMLIFCGSLYLIGRIRTIIK